MCGIFALLNLYDNSIDKFNVKFFMKGKSRGPETSIMKTYKNKCILGFHRLAISTLKESANQPLQLNKCSLICNGEIYNYEYLHKLIDTPNVSGSDCEIIIHLYLKYGMETTLNLLDGVFGFVLFDKQKKVIYTARDTFGVRPLFSMIGFDFSLGFASEMKMLVDISDYSTILSHQPGTYSKYSYNRYQHKTTLKPKKSKFFWQQDFVHKPFSSLNYGINHLLATEEIIFSSIRQTLMSAVSKRVLNCQKRPIACLLSGGLDSSLVVSIVNQLLPNNTLETYSIGIKGSEDLKYAKIVADFLGTKHTQIEMTEKEFLDAIPETIQAIESYDTTTVRASVGNYLVSKYISEHSQAKIIFNGDGSDEVCGGYMYFHYAPNAIEFDIECRRLLKDIHYFDVLRSDRSISSCGLEARTPFLDRAFVLNYLSIPPDFRHHAGKNQCEKYLLRKAFESTNLLPQEILWRKKEAFSDGVSSQKKSWYEIIQEHVKTEPIQKIISEPDNLSREEMDFSSETLQIVKHNTPVTDEQKYYRKLFQKYYTYHSNVIPYFWMPKFIDATDSSARTLEIYKKN